MRKNFFLFSLFLAFAPLTLWAQKITVNAKLDSTVLWIGDQANLTFEVSQQPNQKVIMPIFSDTIVGGLEMVAPVKLDTVKTPDGPILVTQRYVVTAFEDSLLYIPPYPFVLDGDTVWSKSLSLKVVQPFKIDTAANSITDIKPVFDPKFDWIALIKWILLALVIIALLVLLYFILRKYWMKKPIFESTPEIILAPYEIALNKLNKIKEEKPWQHNRSKEYHTELVDVMREYIEKTFDVNSMEMTSIEILAHLSDLRRNNKTAYNGLKQMFQLADLVKFAKFNPTPDEHELSLTNAYHFVNSTKVELTKPLEVITEQKPTSEKDETNTVS